MARRKTDQPAAPPHTPRRHVSRLNSLKSCRVEAARLTREAILGARPTSEVYQLVCCVSMVGKMISGQDLEQRVAELERLLSLEARR